MDPMRYRDAVGLGSARHRLARRGVQQFLPRLPPGSHYSHATAARLHGLELPPWLEADERLHVTTPTGRRALHAEQLVGHQMLVRADEVMELGSLRVSAPHRVWRELAGSLDVPDLVALGDAMIAERRPLTTTEALAESSRRAPRFSGRASALTAIPMLSSRSESRMESRYRALLRLAGLPATVVNEDLTSAGGRFIARLDIRFAGYPVATEYDGAQHALDPRQWQRDVTRLADVEDHGIVVVRATAADLPDFSRPIRRCESLLRRAGWSP